MLGGLSLIGFDNLSLRQIARYKSQKNYALLTGFIIVATSITSLVGIFAFLFFYITLSLIPDYQSIITSYLQENLNIEIYLLAAFMLPFIALTQVYQRLLQGAKHIIRSQIPEMIVRPFILLLLLAIIYFFQGTKLNLQTAIYLQLCAIFIAFLVSIYFFWQKIIKNLPQKISPAYDMKIWLKASLAFFLLNSISLINVRADILMLSLIHI